MMERHFLLWSRDGANFSYQWLVAIWPTCQTFMKCTPACWSHTLINIKERKTAWVHGFRCDSVWAVSFCNGEGKAVPPLRPAHSAWGIRVLRPTRDRCRSRRYDTKYSPRNNLIAEAIVEFVNSSKCTCSFPWIHTATLLNKMCLVYYFIVYSVSSDENENGMK